MRKLIVQGRLLSEDEIKLFVHILNNTVYTQPAGNVYRWDGVDASLSESLSALGQKLGVDMALPSQNSTLNDFRLLAMDMDSTFITIECIDEIADYCGVKSQVAAITEAAMRGEMDFNESLTRRVALLAGLDASVLEKVYEERLRVSPGADKLLAGLKTAGVKTLLVSGGFTFFTEKLKTKFALDYAKANVLETVNGKLTGKVIGTIVNAEEKANTLLQVCSELGISPKQSIAMGDGSNDLRMMAAAGLSIAYHAKPKTRAAADVALNHVGLDGVLNLFL